MSKGIIEGFRFMSGAMGLVVALSGDLPEDTSYTLRATPEEVVFTAGQKELGRFPYRNSAVFNMLTRTSSVGVVRYEVGKPFDGEVLFNTMYVQTAYGQAVIVTPKPGVA